MSQILIHVMFKKIRKHVNKINSHLGYSYIKMTKMAAANTAVVHFVYPVFIFEPSFKLNSNWKIFLTNFHFYNLLIIIGVYKFCFP